MYINHAAIEWKENGINAWSMPDRLAAYPIVDENQMQISVNDGRYPCNPTGRACF
jgi:hypothetical protein